MLAVAAAECDWSVDDADTPAPLAVAGRYYTADKKINVRCANCRQRGHLSKVCPEPIVSLSIQNVPLWQD